MKTIPTAIAILSFASVSLAADTPLPPELVAARARYDAAVAAAMKPVRDKYIAEIQQIKSRALFDKNAKLAVAIDEELKSMTGGSLKQALANSTWLWWETETITFLNNGKARWSRDGKDSFTWKVSNDDERKIVGETAKQDTFTIIFTPELTEGTLTEGNATARQVKRIKSK